MRIGILTDAYEPLISGVVTSIKTLKDGLEALGHEVIILAPNSPKVKHDEDPNVVRLKGWAVPIESFKGYRLVLGYKKYLKVIKSLNLDVIHVHTEFGVGRLGLYAKKKLGIPVVYTMHTMYESYIHHISKFLAKYAKKSSLNYVKKVLRRFVEGSNETILPTEKVLDIVKRYNIDGNYHIVPSGINLQPFYKESHSKDEVDQLKRNLGITNEFVCLFVGRVAAEKSIDLLLEAYNEFQKNHPNSKFIIIGDGPYKVKLDKEIEHLNLTDKVKTLGFITRDKIGLYYQIGDVFLNASTTETQGLTYVEALAASLPAVVRYDSVLANFIEDGYNGLFFNTKEELINHLSNLYINKNKCEELSNAARNSISQYSQEVYAQKVLAIYEKIVKKD